MFAVPDDRTSRSRDRSDISDRLPDPAPWRTTSGTVPPPVIRRCSQARGTLKPRENKHSLDRHCHAVPGGVGTSRRLYRGGKSIIANTPWLEPLFPTTRHVVLLGQATPLSPSVPVTA